MLTSINFIYVQFLDLEMHRIEYTKNSLTFFNNLTQKILKILYIPSSLNWTFVKILPYTFISIPIIVFSFISQNKTVKKLLILVLCIHLFLLVLDTKLLISIYNNNNIFIKILNPFLLTYYIPFVYSLIFIYLMSDNKYLIKKSLIFLSFVSIFLFQVNSSIIPFQKKIIVKEENYRNFYTFKGYYLYDDYKKIKAIVKNKRLFSLNLDPMAAAMNDINIIDGYHSMYPLTYKIKFRKIIENELRENLTAKNYYDRWGSRVYAFTRESKEDLINFDEAKKVGADYVLSKNVINNNKVLLVCDDCSNYFKLYKIK